MYLLPCPHCHESISVSPSQAGDSAKCPHCGGDAPIPKLGELRRLPQADDVDNSQQELPAAGASSIASVLLGMVGVIALFVAGFAAIQWYLVDVPTSTDEHVAKMKAEYEKMEAARFIREFEHMETYRLEVPSMFDYKIAELKRRRWGTNALIAGGIALTSLLAAFVLASSGRTPKPEA